LVGPLEAKTAAKSYEDKMHLQPDTVSFGPPAPGVDSTYVLNAIYVLPSERRKGHSYKIIEFAKQLALKENNGAKVTLALILDDDNVPAMKSYEKSGFEVVHRYWFDDTRGVEVKKTQAAVMRVDVGVDDSA
jgi:GNAT superfamily N-acetyltransferase